MKTRRRLLADSAALAAGALGLGAARAPGPARPDEDDLFQVSLAQWSLHRKLRAGELDALDFPRYARERFDIRAVEYVNQFFADKATDFGYLRELAKRAEDQGVRSLLIMIDGEGALAAADDGERRRAIHNHFRWIAAAAFLGCHSIRVNAAGASDWEDGIARAADSLRQLAEIGAPYGVDVIVENHGGLSSNGAWLASVMKKADHPRVGTLPDFGNFSLGNGEWYDRYQGVGEMMPFAKAVSAKSHDFDEQGNETHTDYRRMLGIVLAAGYHGFIGVEYEGDGLSEDEGILHTRDLLLRLRKELAGH